jgi:purine-binding chemotaxis protein CheW
VTGVTVEIDFDELRRRLDQAEARLAGAEHAEQRRAEILEERGRAIAGTRKAERAETLPVLVFTVGGERYAVTISAVSQVVEAKGLWPLPASPPWLLGAIVARTRVVPVFDLRQLLGLEGRGMSDLGRIVVVEHEGDAFGLAVEALEGRVEVPRDGLAPAEKGPFGWIGPDRLALLDLARLAAPAAGGA